MRIRRVFLGGYVHIFVKRDLQFDDPVVKVVLENEMVKEQIS